MIRGTGHRLRLQRVEAKPKRVEIVGDELDVRIALTSAQREDLRTLVRSIREGRPLPDRFYRPSRERRGDDLLVRSGYMHLHLDGPSDALVYLIQYADRVLLICVDDHANLRSRPPGARISDYAVRQAEQRFPATAQDGESDDG